MKKIIILGSNGQLGNDLLKIFTPEKYEIAALARTDIDAENPETFQVLDNYKDYDYIINCVSYHKTDECEDFPEKSFIINSAFVYKLAKFCAANEIALFHISTDYVFDGQKELPYKETDAIGPLSVYGLSKTAGEQAIKAYAEKYFIFRVSSLFGEAGASGKGGNFVETMLKLGKDGTPLKVIADQIMAPTHTLDIARAIEAFVSEKVTAYGIYNCCNSGSCSWFEFTETLFKMAGVNADLSKTTYTEYKTKAKRPKYSVLDNSRLSAFFKMPDWKDALNEYMKIKKYIC